MMDIEKLIEQLSIRGLGNGTSLGYHSGLFDEAATALSALQAENAQLRAEIEQMTACIYYKPGGLCRYGGDDPANVCVFGPCPHEVSAQEFLSELENVKRERDAAVDCCSGYCASCLFVKDCAKHDMNDAAPTRWYYGDCEDWEWRGWKED